MILIKHFPLIVSTQLVENKIWKKNIDQKRDGFSHGQMRINLIEFFLFGMHLLVNTKFLRKKNSFHFLYQSTFMITSPRGSVT